MISCHYFVWLQCADVHLESGNRNIMQIWVSAEQDRPAMYYFWLIFQSWSWWHSNTWRTVSSSQHKLDGLIFNGWPRKVQDSREVIPAVWLGLVYLSHNIARNSRLRHKINNYYHSEYNLSVMFLVLDRWNSHTNPYLHINYLSPTFE